MAAELGIWPFLARKTASRLAFMSHPSTPNVVRVPCRLPDCTKPVKRSTRPGRPKWFHHHKCADAFRIRQRALDAAIDDLAAKFLSADYTTREKAAIRADLEWLVDVRMTYAGPGSWRTPSARPEDLRADDPGVRFIAEVHAAVSRPERADRCPTCQGTGDLSHLRPQLSPHLPMAKRRAETDTYAEIAGLFKRLAFLRGSAPVVEAYEYWETRAAAAEHALQRTLRTGDAAADEK